MFYLAVTGKGSFTLKDLQRVAAAHDFVWTDKELADMIRCFDSDNDGKVSDAFRLLSFHFYFIAISNYLVMWCF